MPGDVLMLLYKHKDVVQLLVSLHNIPAFGANGPILGQLVEAKRTIWGMSSLSGMFLEATDMDQVLEAFIRGGYYRLLYVSALVDAPLWDRETIEDIPAEVYSAAVVDHFTKKTSGESKLSSQFIDKLATMVIRDKLVDIFDKHMDYFGCSGSQIWNGAMELYEKTLKYVGKDWSHTEYPKAGMHISKIEKALRAEMRKFVEEHDKPVKDALQKWSDMTFSREKARTNESFHLALTGAFTKLAKTLNKPGVCGALTLEPNEGEGEGEGEDQPTEWLLGGISSIFDLDYIPTYQSLMNTIPHDLEIIHTTSFPLAQLDKPPGIVSLHLQNGYLANRLAPPAEWLLGGISSIFDLDYIPICQSLMNTIPHDLEIIHTTSLPLAQPDKPPGIVSLHLRNGYLAIFPRYSTWIIFLSVKA
ncbi:hypothetical protein C8J57DRAFT_1220926 [Mycena rebaudengoi]|nr:hypothetical protein C8J57DRAFT_1220926 [Mycena rebaudengoi]